MTQARRSRLAGLPHDQRVALRERILRDAAQNYGIDAGTAEERPAAAALREAALEYATAVLLRTASMETAARPVPPAAQRVRGEKEPG